MIGIRIPWLFVLLVLVLACSKAPQNTEEERFNDKRAVLQVNDNKLTLGEVEKRYSATDFKNAQDEYEQKRGFVEQFLERFLLMEGAREAGMIGELDTAVVRRNLLRQFYNEKIVKNIEVSDSEIKKFFARYGGEFQAGHIVVDSVELADSLYEALKDGADFEQLVTLFSKDESTIDKGGSLGYVTYGRYDERFQEAAFNLKIGEISKPVKTRTGWHIIKLYDRIKNTREDLEQNKKNYYTMTHQYLEKLKVREFAGQVRKKFHYETQQSTIDYLIRKADSSKALSTLPPNLPSSAYLVPSYFSADEMKMYLVKCDRGGTTVEDYLDLLGGYAPERAPELRDRALMEEILEGLALPPLFESMARDEGFDKSDRFLAELEYLKGTVLMQKMRDALYSDLEPVTESDVAQHYNDHKGEFIFPDQIRASAITVKTKEEADELLSRIKNGANFYQMAKKYSVDKKTGSIGGDLNFFTEKRFTPIYRAAANMEKGSVGGPVEFEGNWWIFKVTDRLVNLAKGLELVSAEIASQLAQERRAKLYDEFIARMREKSRIEMDLDLIKNNLKTGTYSQSGQPKG
jgi:parvulin-like peptidyl-prolyl isomerase